MTPDPALALAQVAAGPATLLFVDDEKNILSSLKRLFRPHGYADISSTVAAINRGEISRYISKPWEDNDVVPVVKQALERKMLEREKKLREGILLLARDYMLDDSLIGQIKAFEQTEGITIKIHVRASMEETLPHL